MKNGQYFAVVDGSEDMDDPILVLGQVKENYLYSEEDNNNWDSITTGGKYLSRRNIGLTSEKLDLYKDCNLYGYTGISKVRYEELKKSKKERTALLKQLVKAHYCGRFLDWQVIKIGDEYVFGCGELVATKKDLRDFIKAAEGQAGKEEKIGELQQEIDDLQDKLNDLEGDDGTDSLRSEVQSAMSRNGVNLDKIDEDEIKRVKKMLTV